MKKFLSLITKNGRNPCGLFLIILSPGMEQLTGLYMQMILLCPLKWK